MRDVLGAIGIKAVNQTGYNTQFGIALNTKLKPQEIVPVGGHLLMADTSAATTPADSTQTQVEQLKTDFNINEEGLDMVFFATPDAPPLPVYEPAIIVSAASSPVRKMAYGVCEFATSTNSPVDDMRDKTDLFPQDYMADFLHKKFTDKLGRGASPDVLNQLVDWQASLSVKVLRAPQHGKIVGAGSDSSVPEAYLPDEGFTGKDRVDLLVQ